MKRKEQEFYARAMVELPRILLGCERGNVRYARLGLIKWLRYSPRKALRGKLPVRYRGLTLRFAVNVDFSFSFFFFFIQKGAALQTASNFSLLYQQIVEKKAMRIKKIISLGVLS